MTVDDLRAAAERLAAWPDTTDGVTRERADAMAVARAWLAEHPADDGEAATAADLRAAAGHVIREAIPDTPDSRADYGAATVEYDRLAVAVARAYLALTDPTA